MSVLQKLLKSVEKTAEMKPEQIVQEFLKTPEKAFQKKSMKPKGRPVVAEKDKARNFTLCLAKNYLAFLDGMKVKDPKVKGRGRKIRFIIDRFLEHERRQVNQMKVLKKAIQSVETTLRDLTHKKSTDLTTREKAEIDKAVSQVETLTKILGFTTKELHRMLPKNEWAVMSFCLNWQMKKGIKL